MTVFTVKLVHAAITSLKTVTFQQLVNALIGTVNKTWKLCFGTGQAVVFVGSVTTVDLAIAPEIDFADDLSLAVGKSHF